MLCRRLLGGCKVMLDCSTSTVAPYISVNREAAALACVRSETTSELASLYRSLCFVASSLSWAGWTCSQARDIMPECRSSSSSRASSPLPPSLLLLGAGDAAVASACASCAWNANSALAASADSSAMSQETAAQAPAVAASKLWERPLKLSRRCCRILRCAVWGDLTKTATSPVCLISPPPNGSEIALYTFRRPRRLSRRGDTFASSSSSSLVSNSDSLLEDSLLSSASSSARGGAVAG
mmetsp:Transcript_123236/g.307732  ORF Transcript_123236/g.307732 Transcript_123236/m.307732 type:complete len:239 (-) Transcript_123236:111-827(-)